MSSRPVTIEDLRWIVCPVCHQPLQLQGDIVVCLGCARRYPLVDGIPVLLADRAI
ncbi:MAG: Trm112 family protein [Edaphobacter sp.]